MLPKNRFSKRSERESTRRAATPPRSVAHRQTRGVDLFVDYGPTGSEGSPGRRRTWRNLRHFQTRAATGVGVGGSLGATERVRLSTGASGHIVFRHQVLDAKGERSHPGSRTRYAGRGVRLGRFCRQYRSTSRGCRSQGQVGRGNRGCRARTEPKGWSGVVAIRRTERSDRVANAGVCAAVYSSASRDTLIAKSSSSRRLDPYRCPRGGGCVPLGVPCKAQPPHVAGFRVKERAAPRNQ